MSEKIDKAKYLEKVDPKTPISEEEYRDALRGAHKARTTVCFLIWKKMKELYPDIDADKVMIEAYSEFGIKAGEKWGYLESAGEGLYKQSSRGGYSAFGQELVAFSDDYAQKNFHYCPHVEAMKALGASAEDIKFFCQEILSAGDYGNLIPHEGYSLEFKKQIGAGDDHCEYCLTKCDKKK